MSPLHLTLARMYRTKAAPLHHALACALLGLALYIALALLSSN